MRTHQIKCNIHHKFGRTKTQTHWECFFFSFNFFLIIPRFIFDFFFSLHFCVVIFFLFLSFSLQLDFNYLTILLRRNSKGEQTKKKKIKNTKNFQMFGPCKSNKRQRTQKKVCNTEVKSPSFTFSHKMRTKKWRARHTTSRPSIWLSCLLILMMYQINPRTNISWISFR